jgi:tetratricopeptide (TPR) repeat protein
MNRYINASILALALALDAASGVAQTYDPKTQSPLSLTAAPADGVAYYALSLRARALVREKKYAEAEPLYEQLVREYPRDGENWALLGVVRRHLDKHVEAADASTKAGRILGPEYPYYTDLNSAGELLAAGNRRAALDVIARSVFERRAVNRASIYNMTAFASLRNDPEFLRIIGRPDPKGWTRTKGWQYDIDLLYGEIERVTTDYRDSLPSSVTRQYRQLRRDIPKLTDQQLLVGLNRMLAGLKMGHTGLWSSSEIEINQLPLQPWAFPEGVFITDAGPGHADLVGTRLIAVGGAPVEVALRAVNELQSIDGDMDYLRMGILLMIEPSVLKTLGVITRDDTVAVTVDGSDGTRREVRLASEDATRRSILVPPPGVEAPLFLRDLSRLLLEQPMPEHHAHYVRVHGISNDSAETLGAFGIRLRSVLAASGATNVILDVRGNEGGSTALYTELLRTLVAHSTVPGHQLYVLIDRETYSAAGNLITDLERLADPIFVGEPSGECCNLHGDAATVSLPYSKLRGAISAVRWNQSHPWDARREIVPQIPVALTAKAYFAGEDPALAAIFRVIASAPASGAPVTK